MTSQHSSRQTASADSDSSSESEEDARLKERFISVCKKEVGNLNVGTLGDTNTASARLQTKTKIKKVNKPSLRLQGDDDLHHQEENELETTAEFRAYVAKKLLSVIESSADIVEQNLVTKHEIDGNMDRDFRLFSTSVPGAKRTDQQKVSKRKYSSSSSSSADEEKLASVAVTAESIFRNASSGYYDAVKSSQNAETKELFHEEVKVTQTECSKFVVDNHTRVSTSTLDSHNCKKKRHKKNNL